MRIGAASALLAEALGQPPEWCEMIRFAAPMHDVGKIDIPDHILKKPAPLDDGERAIMNMHPGSRCEDPRRGRRAADPHGPRDRPHPS